MPCQYGVDEATSIIRRSSGRYRQSSTKWFLRWVAEAARSFNIMEVNDVLLYCCAALEHGADFDRCAPWSERLARYRQGAMTLEKALTDAR